jgi:hypothetical protein
MKRADDLAARIEEGAEGLAAFAATLSETEWRTVVPGDGRTAGVTVHHVASVYPIEIDLARAVASGKPIVGVTGAGIAEMNAKHAKDHAAAGKQETVALLRTNAKAAADAVRRFTDAELDSATLVSLNGNAPLTAQFVLEDHAVRHSWHHLERIRRALGRPA